MAAMPDADIDDFLATVAVTRLVLGPRCGCRRRPIWCRATECLALLGAGVDDWGGVSPLTPDHVNPERPWPALDELAAVTAEAGFDLVQRLTAQPRYVQAGAAWIDPRVRAHVAALADPQTGFALDVNPVGSPWQEPDEAGESPGPHRPAHRHRHRGPAHRDPQRSGQRVRRLGVDPRTGAASWPPARPNASTPTCSPRCARRAQPGRLQRRRVPGAGHRRRARAGCRCRAGGFAAPRRGRRRRHLRRQPQHQLHQHLLHRLPVLRVRPAQGRRRRVLAVHSTRSADRAEEAHVAGATEVCMQGGIDPELPVTGVRRPGPRGQGARAVDARARLLADGDRQRRHQERL